MIIHQLSHVDHVPQEVLDWVAEHYADRDVPFFIETITLPDHLPTLENGLYGPLCGDEPVSESDVFYETRANRSGPSRMIDRPKRQTRTVTVIGGKTHEVPSGECVLFTVYGGPCAPREPYDASITSEEERQRSRDFWRDHALAK